MSKTLPDCRLPSLTIRSTTVGYKGWSTLTIAEIDTTVHGQPATLRREVHDHGSGAAVLAYDPIARTAVLVRQMRVPPLLNGDAPATLEVIAGLIDGDEDSEATVRREAMEEAGLTLTKVSRIGFPYSSPGAISERIALHLAEIDPTAPRHKGGGLADEHEELEVLDLPLATLADMADVGEIVDLKTLMLVERLRRLRPELFESEDV